MAALACPSCHQRVDFKRARIDPTGDDGVEIVTCPECGGRFFTERAPLNFTGMWLALLTVSLLAGVFAPRPLNEAALVALAALIILPALRALVWGASS